jgi:hypothetical protein
MGKALLIILLGSIVTLAIIRINFLGTVDSGTKNAVNYYNDIEARNIGHAMVNMLLARIADSAQYRCNSSLTKSFIDGTVDYRVIDTELVAGDPIIKIEANVEYYGFEKKVISYTRKGVPTGWVPPFIRGAWTANGPLNNTISDMFIDGRDYDLNLNIVPGSGTNGISSSVEFINVENAAIGGTHDSVDYPMTFPEDDAIIEENYDWGGSFPKSPDEILGYPEGTLKAIAQSGAQGSQYLLNPGKIEDALTFPLSGVTFIELTDGVERELKMHGNGNGGILVVHGPDASSRLKGVKMEETKVGKDEVEICHSPGTIDESTLIINEDDLDTHLAHGDFEGSCNSNSWFEGLIITDYSFHHHLDILGAVLQLSSNLETEKNCNGNADHWAKFSRDAIENATGIAATESELFGNSDNSKYNTAGFGTGRQKAMHWFE